MEDAHSVHLFLPSSGQELDQQTSASNIPAQPEGSTVTNDNEPVVGNALFGVFDGHGGQAVAKFAGTTLHSRLAALQSYKSGDYEEALNEAFIKTDEDLRANPTFLNDPSGCTAVVGLLTTDGRIIVANSGDSRSVLGYKGVAKAMSNDHKPTNTDETARITAAGGFVEFGRVNGNLALSRAMGDFEFKQNFSLPPEQQIVTVVPEIITHHMDGEEEFLVLACDGIWDCLSSQQVVDFTRRAIANGDSLGKICEDMMVKCLAKDSSTGGIGCDNMTVVIVALLNGRTPEEWQNWVKKKVEDKIGHDTPESIPDIFPENSAPSNPFKGTGFRVAGGAGGLANIASILGASGITFRPAYGSDDDDDDDSIHTDEEQLLDQSSPFLIGSLLDNKDDKDETASEDVKSPLNDEEALSGEGKNGSVQLMDSDGDSAMDSDDSDSTTTAKNTTSQPIQHQNQQSSPIPPSFSSIGSPTVPTPEALQRSSHDAAKTGGEPQGDAYSGAVKVEGLMDMSENPLNV
nr:PP2Cc protein phosphatase [Cryptococcus depauperatus CBS 7855]